MSRTTLKVLVLIALCSLLANQIAGAIVDLLGMAWGAATTLVVVAVTFGCTHLASGGARMKGWYLVPTILFVVLPALWRILQLVTRKVTGWEVLVGLLPLVFGLILPGGILLFIFWRLLREEQTAA